MIMQVNLYSFKNIKVEEYRDRKEQISYKERAIEIADKTVRQKPTTPQDLQETLHPQERPKKCGRFISHRRKENKSSKQGPMEESYEYRYSTSRGHYGPKSTRNK
jgi:hypothetical protein